VITWVREHASAKRHVSNDVSCPMKLIVLLEKENFTHSFFDPYPHPRPTHGIPLHIFNNGIERRCPQPGKWRLSFATLALRARPSSASPGASRAAVFSDASCLGRRPPNLDIRPPQTRPPHLWPATPEHVAAPAARAPTSSEPAQPRASHLPGYSSADSRTRPPNNFRRPLVPWPSPSLATTGSNQVSGAAGRGLFGRCGRAHRLGRDHDGERVVGLTAIRSQHPLLPLCASGFPLPSREFALVLQLE
jgi:hypothetical protein